MKTETVKISEVKSNPNNPRVIKDDNFRKLVNSIKEFPKMLKIRPIVVNDDMIVLGGNMRLKACKEAGLQEVPIIKAGDLTEDEQRQFIIKDNVSGGEWDWDMLASDWDTEKLENWGLDMLNFENDLDDQNNDEINIDELFDIELPFYTPSKTIPPVNELANTEKTKELLKKINRLKINDELKEVLKIRAQFFTDFNFQKIADYYSKQDKEIKEVFEDLGMIIIAPKEALKRGFVELTNYIKEE